MACAGIGFAPGRIRTRRIRGTRCSRVSAANSGCGSQSTTGWRNGNRRSAEPDKSAIRTCRHLRRQRGASGRRYPMAFSCIPIRPASRLRCRPAGRDPWRGRVRTSGPGRRTFPPRRPDDRAEGRPADRLAGERTVGGRSAERLRANLAGSGRVRAGTPPTGSSWDGRNGQIHVLNRNVRVSDARAYALYWSTSESMWKKPGRDVRRHCAKLPAPG